ncbi:MAG: TIGR04282 family arsenosugar biosynthesis glycosyltransferase [Gammaproteobacteria bacterium]
MAAEPANSLVKPALAIFVKTPGLSPIKTRLAAGIGAQAALRFHRLAAAATAEAVSACGPALTPYWAVAEDNAVTHDYWSEFPRLWQGTGTLGERLHRIHTELQTRHGSALMIGADTPQLTPALLQQAITTLKKPGTVHVLGPAKDGGFWLFGSKQPIAAPIWNAIPYSRHNTTEALRHALYDTGNLDTLNQLTDVDTAEDLSVLIETLQNLPNPLPTQTKIIAWFSELEMVNRH